MAENSVTLFCRTKILQLETQTEIIKSLAVQRLKRNELEEQRIHHFNLIKYLVPMTMSILWITSFGKLMEGLKVRNYKSRFMQSSCSLRSGNFIMFLKTNLGYLSQIALKSMQLLVQIVFSNRHSAACTTPILMRANIDGRWNCIEIEETLVSDSGQVGCVSMPDSCVSMPVSSFELTQR